MRVISIVPNKKQEQFFTSTAKYTAYGGARGGGKSWAMRTKLVLLALNYDGIQILLLRRTLGELRENHLIPLQKLLKGIAKYVATTREFRFPNGSRIKLGYCDSQKDVLQYQGQAYEVIGFEEATHFSEQQFIALTESNRVSGNMSKAFSPRMYFTCNPGGVGHDWVKRLFIDKDYKDNEKPENYCFIKSLVFDNHFLLKNNPEYIDTLMALPEARRKAMLYGDWDTFEGRFFPEFDYDLHSCEPFPLEKGWLKFCALDYGLDMTCCLWLCHAPNRIIVYRELYESGLIISEAAERILEMTPSDENIRYTTASPDLWSRRQDSGKSGFDIMTASGIKFLQKANNSRIAGWRVMREYLKGFNPKDKKPKLLIFRNCKNLLRTLPLLRFDQQSKEDAANTPHEITHAPEAMRYALMSREPIPKKEKNRFSSSIYSFDIKRGTGDDYENYINY